MEKVAHPKIVAIQPKIVGIHPAILTLFLLITIGYAIYGDMFSHPFIDYDDHRMIVERQDCYDGLTLENIVNIVLRDYPREEPLIVRDLSYLINAEIFGVLNPRGYLLGNFLLHIVVCFLTYILCIRLFPGNYAVAVMSSLLFMLHPVHVESVAWISSRKDPLYAAFFLGALIGYIDWFRLKNRRFLMTSFILFVCSLMSKPGAISFFPLILCYRLVVDRKMKYGSREGIYEGLVLITTLLYVYFYTKSVKMFGVFFDASMPLDRDWLAWLLSNVQYINFYLLKLALPLQQSILYDYPVSVTEHVNMPYMALSLTVIAICCCVMWCWFKKGKTIHVFLGLFFLCALLPYLELARQEIYVADRYVYLGSLPVLMLAANGIVSIIKKIPSPKRLRKAAVVALVVVISVFWGYKTSQAVSTWRSTLSFWKNANEVASNKIKTYSGLMRHYLKLFIYNNHDQEKARSYVLMAQQVGKSGMERFGAISKGSPPELFILRERCAEVEWLLGNLQKADEIFSEVILIAPSFFEARFMYGTFLFDQKRYREALEQIEIVENGAALVNPYKYQKIMSDIKNRLRPMIENAIKIESKRVDG